MLLTEQKKTKNYIQNCVNNTNLQILSQSFEN